MVVGVVVAGFVSESRRANKKKAKFILEHMSADVDRSALLYSKLWYCDNDA